MFKSILAAILIVCVFPAHAASAAPAVTFNVDTQQYGVPFSINANAKGGNLVAVVRCDSANGSHQEVIESWHGLISVPAMTTPPWPAATELAGVTDTGMFCVAAVGTFKGNGFFQERASDCFYVTIEGTAPDPDVCFI